MKPGNISGIRAVTFDAGGTLLAPHPGVGEVYAEILAQLGVTITPQLINKRFRAVFKDLTAPPPRTIVNETTALAFWREIARSSVSPECPSELFDQVFTRLWREFASARRWRPLPGAAETLASLVRGKNLRVAILSNWDSRLHQVIDELGWRKFLGGGVFISSEMGVEKPDYRAFRAVETTLQLPASAMLHVGDSLTHDYEAARAAGWQAVLVTTKPLVGITSVASLAELPGLFQEGRR